MKGNKQGRGNKETQNKKRESVRLFTSECVTVGHPDKTSDYISDTIVTEILNHDRNARVAAECMVGQNLVVLMGEVTTTHEVDYDSLVREAIRKVGYIHPEAGFNADTVEIRVNIHSQSPDIALGTNDEVGGAGDQGMMFGGAVNETSDLMPLPISIARGMAVKITDIVNAEINDEDPMFRADAKTQVTVAYGRDNLPRYVDTVVVSVSHSSNVSQEVIKQRVTAEVIVPTLEEYGFSIDDVKKIYINPTGSFAVYGPYGDSGLTGRKIIVDTYGGYFSHGGGAFSSKDPSKVDRSGAYMARYIAKNIVAAKLADKCEVQLAYAIGVAAPVSVNINMFGTQKFPVGLICKAVYNTFDMTPAGITREFSMRDGIINYQDLSVYGHFGCYGEVTRPWEETDKADILSRYCFENYEDRK